MSENLKPATRSSLAVQRAGRAAASSALVILQGILVFAAITAALVLIGVGYTHFSWRRLDPLAIPAWFLRLSLEQWIALGVGIAVALTVVLIPCARITGRKPVRDPEWAPLRPRRIMETLAVAAVFLLYAGGLACAYHLSLAFGQSRDWAIIHSLYSWVYVGYAFWGWTGQHGKQPLGKTLRQFLVMMGM